MQFVVRAMEPPIKKKKGSKSSCEGYVAELLQEWITADLANLVAFEYHTPIHHTHLLQRKRDLYFNYPCCEDCKELDAPMLVLCSLESPPEFLYFDAVGTFTTRSLVHATEERYTSYTNKDGTLRVSFDSRENDPCINIQPSVGEWERLEGRGARLLVGEVVRHTDLFLDRHDESSQQTK